MRKILLIFAGIVLFILIISEIYLVFFNKNEILFIVNDKKILFSEYPSEDSDIILFFYDNIPIEKIDNLYKELKKEIDFKDSFLKGQFFLSENKKIMHLYAIINDKILNLEDNNFDLMFKFKNSVFPRNISYRKEENKNNPLDIEIFLQMKNKFKDNEIYDFSVIPLDNDFQMLSSDFKKKLYYHIFTHELIESTLFKIFRLNDPFLRWFTDGITEYCSFKYFRDRFENRLNLFSGNINDDTELLQIFSATYPSRIINKNRIFFENYNNSGNKAEFYNISKHFFNKIVEEKEIDFFKHLFSDLKKKSDEKILISEDVLYSIENIIGKEKLSKILRTRNYFEFIEKYREKLVKYIIKNYGTQDVIETLKKEHWFYNDKTKKIIDLNKKKFN